MFYRLFTGVEAEWKVQCQDMDDIITNPTQHENCKVSSMRLRSINLPTLVSLLRIVLASPTFKGTGNNDHGAKPGSSDFWTKLIISIGLVLAGGVFAGSVYIIWKSNSCL